MHSSRSVTCHLISVSVVALAVFRNVIIAYRAYNFLALYVDRGQHSSAYPVGCVSVCLCLQRSCIGSIRLHASIRFLVWRLSHMSDTLY